MLTKGQIEKYVQVLIWGLKTARKGKYRKRDIVLIQFDPAASRLAEGLHARLLEMGLHPVLRTGMSWTMERNFYKLADGPQLVFETPGQRELLGNLNGSIYLRAPESLTHLGDVDPKKIGKTALARKPLREILDRREERGLFGWTLCMMPTEALARQAGLTPKQYAAQLSRACYLDKADPVGAWKEVYRKARGIKKWLNSLDVAAFHIESDRIDLRITPGTARRWVGISGHNIPSFELFLSPDWRGTEGVYYANQPSFRNGNVVEGVRLVFRRGSVTEVQAEKGREFVLQQTAMDRGASRLGEFSLTDKRFSRINRFMANTLFDENYGGAHGNCHLALGSSYSDTYAGDPARLTKALKKQMGFNDSALHWDLVNTERKRVTAHLRSGEKRIVYEDGRFNWG